MFISMPGLYRLSVIARFLSGLIIAPDAFATTSGGLSRPIGIAIDTTGNVWVMNGYNNTLTELIGAAVRTRTPLVKTLTEGFVP